MADFDLLQSASTLPLFVCLPADGFRFLFVSEAARAAFGHSREALMRLRHRQDAHFPLPTIDEYWHRLLQNEAVRIETRLGTENGHSASVTIRFERLIHADQAFLLGHFCEPVQPPAIEQQLAEARLTAERALQVRDRFLTHMSHELRTPLSGIIGLSHLARDTESLILARDYFRQIHHSGERLLTTLSDILDFCQIETGTMMLHPVSFNPGALIQEIIQVVKTEALDKRLTLLIRVEPELPAYLIGDAQRLRQVLLNLVGNAVKFTPQGQVSVQIKQERHQPDGQIWIRFSVSDSGTGIHPDDHARLFQAFEQLDPSDNRHHQGSGLGLALAWHLVKLMGGDGIELTSVPGQGSTFSLVLPFELATISILRQYDIQIVDAVPLSGLNILIVEDNEINHRIARAMMEKAGATVSLAQNGAVAVEMLKQAAPNTWDVVLMDIQMPVMDGYTATRRIRQDLKLVDVPVIAVTAHAMSTDRQACLEVGMNAHVSKPINQKLLISTILHSLPHKSDILLAAPQPGDDPALQLATLINMNRTFQESIPHLSAALTSLGNDEQLYIKLTRLFVAQHADDLRQLERCLTEGNHAEADMLSHTLKELSHTLGLFPLHEAVTQLHFRIHSHPDEWPEAELAQVHTEMQATLRALRQLLLGLPG